MPSLRAARAHARVAGTRAASAAAPTLQCACAACVEEMTGRPILNVAQVPDDIIAADHLIVGKYAIQFLWTDGHDSGIYPFQMLLRLAANDDVVVCE